MNNHQDIAPDAGKRRYCEKNQQNQATVRAGFACLRKRKAHTDAHEA